MIALVSGRLSAGLHFFFSFDMAAVWFAAIVPVHQNQTNETGRTNRNSAPFGKYLGIASPAAPSDPPTDPAPPVDQQHNPDTTSNPPGETKFIFEQIQLHSCLLLLALYVSHSFHFH